MTSISEAVVLMAGQGSRLRGSDKTLLKPLIPMLGRPLICYTIEALIRAGIRKASFIVGYQSDRMTSGIKQLIPSGLEPSFIENREWQKQNGISVLAAANHITSPFLLTMSDHLFDQSIVNLLLRNAALDELNLAIDRKLDSIFDERGLKPGRNQLFYCRSHPIALVTNDKVDLMDSSLGQRIDDVAN